MSAITTLVLIKIGIELRDGTRNLRSHQDRDYRVDCSRGFNEIFNLSSSHLGGEVLGLGASVQIESKGVRMSASRTGRRVESYQVKPYDFSVGWISRTLDSLPNVRQGLQFV